ncbi:uncharacterized protein [Drosophila bipectinata]|uniref:uncharacterized protein n=1 Tax=Drosophila bipectinata TaxID=42026 RepID=UPI0038B2E286
MTCEPLTIYKTTNVECGTAPKYSANASCVVKAINWNKAVANMDVYLVRQLKNISVRFQVFKRDYSNKMQPWLVDVTINMCDIIERRNFLAYGKLILRFTKTFSNFNHSCPFSGHLFGRGVYIDEKLLPNVLSLGLYKFSILIFENFKKKPKEYAGSIIFYAEAMTPYVSKRNKTRPESKKP